MDLIFADKNKVDKGVMMSYKLDMAYGKDENNFTCIIGRDSHCCKSGYILYVENEEYGGIIDLIKVNTKSGDLTYSGRTWHGILEEKVICPDPGQDYLLLNGDANEVIGELIERMDLSDLFEADTEPSGIEISDYQAERYVYGYTGMRQMLKTFNAKLKMRWSGDKILLYAETIHDYSQDEELDTSQVDFTVEKNFRPINHIICLGQGDLKDRAVIHVFCDENGGVQPYSEVDVPLQDSDYILDQRNKQLEGSDERVEVYDCGNAAITENYVQLDSKPDDWDTNYASYYEQNEEGSYNEVKGEDDTSYLPLTTQPADWDANYGEYFTLEEGEYKAVEGITTEEYTKLTQIPVDWSKNYGNYYYFYSDGVTSEYKKVEGVSKNRYNLQTRKPTDWSSEYSHYYRKATAKELKKNKNKSYYSVEGVKKKVNGSTTTVAPTWSANKYYTQESYQVAPKFDERNRYILSKTIVSAPTWNASSFYAKHVAEKTPVWLSEIYFEKVFDRYAVMIDEAVKKFEEYYQSTELEIDLEETDQNYDVGDIVGSNEEVTRITAVQEVTKKIIKISNGDVSITYEVN